jgi:hypothetical protein
MIDPSDLPEPERFAYHYNLGRALERLAAPEAEPSLLVQGGKSAFSEWR